jgi:hypothetical protein
MRIQSPLGGSPAADAGGAVAPHTLFILPELVEARRRQLAVLILADGNRRSSSSGGYAGGARRVVSIAEHLAGRRDVGTMVACILSPDNIAKRGNGFFFELYREFIQLGVEIATRGALIASGVHLEIWGDLESLRARGGHAALLADAIEAVAAMTDGVEDPALRLLLGVGYGRDTARELDVDLILRTGMEEPGALRLSGLRTSARIASVGTATLWPAIEPREIDELIALCPRRRSPRFTPGHGTSAIVDLIVALAKADSDAPVHVTIPTSAPRAALAAAIARLFEGPLRGCENLAVEHAGDPATASERHGSRASAPHVLRIVRGWPSAWPSGDGALLSVLAPGQRPPSFTLPDWLALDHANVHACDAAAPEILAGIRAAQRFSAAHPPLLGRERACPGAADQRSPPAAPPISGATHRDALGDRFAARLLAWAASAGLMLPQIAWRTAARNYALTAFFIHFRIPTEWDPTGAAWEDRAELAAKYMLLVAAGDEGVFDRTFAGETPEQRWSRLEISSRFLRASLRSEGSPPPAPRVEGAELLSAIAGEWRCFEDWYCRACLPAAAASFRAGLDALYAGSLAEHRAGIGATPLLDPADAGRQAISTAIERRFGGAPACVAARARELSLDVTEAATGELRALAYLAEVGGAIGAGLLFRAAALAAPAPSVTRQAMATLDAAATLLDYHVRLSNDLSGFLESPSGDRDSKENACTILVPGSASGVARAAAIVSSVATCRALAAWLGAEIAGEMARLAAAWPSMGVIFQRGVFVGRRVYEVGHYTTVSREEMSAIFAEADAALGAGGERPERDPDARFESTVNTPILAWRLPDDLPSVFTES